MKWKNKIKTKEFWFMVIRVIIALVIVFLVVSVAEYYIQDYLRSVLEPVPALREVQF